MVNGKWKVGICGKYGWYVMVGLVVSGKWYIVQYVPKKTCTCCIDDNQQLQVFFGTYCRYHLWLTNKMFISATIKIQRLDRTGQFGIGLDWEGRDETALNLAKQGGTYLRENRIQVITSIDSSFVGGQQCWFTSCTS